MTGSSFSLVGEGSSAPSPWQKEEEILQFIRRLYVPVEMILSSVGGEYGDGYLQALAFN